MKILKYILIVALLATAFIACQKQNFKDTSFVSTAASAAKLSVMFNITQDNTGLVTIIPNGEGAVTYDVYYGDSTTTPTTIAAGKNTKHIYTEGVYTVKIVAHDIKGSVTTFTQQLTVSFRPPADLKVNVATNGLNVTVSASALYETYFQVFYGDSNSVTPVPYTSFLEGQTVSHNYSSAGVYILKVVALSGGVETTTYSDTIHVAKQINLPVTFEDPNTDYTMTDFGGNISSLVQDPTNGSNHVIKAIKTAGAQSYAGTTIGTALGFATPIPLVPTNTSMTVLVYSPAVGLDVKLKVEDHNDATHSVEKDVKTTVANQWQTLTFDFSQQATGTAAINFTYTYDKASIFFDFGNTGTGSVFYFDNVQMAPPPLKQINLPVTFEDTTVNYTVTDFGGNISVLTTDPTNTANHVMQSTKTAGAQTYAGTTIGTALGFASPIPLTATNSKMTVLVYSPAAGLDIKLKVEDHTNGTHSVETDVKSTVANQWETLTFDFSQPASGTASFNSSYTYDKASIFFDFGNAGTGSVFYFDNVQMGVAATLQQIDLPVTFDDPTVDYTVTDFGNNSSVLTTDPTNSSNHVMKSTKTVGAATYAGTTIGTSLGFAHAIPISSSRTKMTVLVYSPAAGIDVKLKIEDHNDATHSVETDVKTTLANQWETLTFDFSQPASGTAAFNASYTYDKASIFFDFGNTGDGRFYYWDNVMIL